MLNRFVQCRLMFLLLHGSFLGVANAFCPCVPSPSALAGVPPGGAYVCLCWCCRIPKFPRSAVAGVITCNSCTPAKAETYLLEILTFCLCLCSAGTAKTWCYLPVLVFSKRRSSLVAANAWCYDPHSGVLLLARAGVTV